MTPVTSFFGKIFAAGALAALAFATPATARHHEKDIVDIAASNSDFSTLVAAVQAAGLVDTLKGDGPFTVFAPTNDAFAALPDGTVESLLQPENKDQLVKILTCHVVAGDIDSLTAKTLINQNANALPLETVGGCVFTGMTNGRQIMIEDGMGGVSTVIAEDVDASNGVIHVIDAVLLPAPEKPMKHH